MTLLAVLVLLTALVLAFVEAAFIHFFNARFRIWHSTYLHCFVIALLTGIVAIVFQILQYAFPQAAIPLWIAGFVATVLLADRLYAFYFRTHFLRFLGAWGCAAAAFAAAVLFLSGLFVLYVAEPVQLLDDSMRPAYDAGDYVLIERFDRIVPVGSAALVSVSVNGVNSLQLLRAEGLPGTIVHGVTIPRGTYYFANDSAARSGLLVPAQDIVGMAVLDLGQ